MSFNVVVPPLGESVSEATVAKWHKKVGDTVQVDDLLVELETDKVTLEVNSPAAGVIEEIASQVGANVTVGEILGKVGGAAVAAAPVGQEAEKKVEGSRQVAPAIHNSPAATKIALDKGIDIASVSGSGRDGRVMKQDVLSHTTTSMGQNIVADTKAVRQERVRMTKLRKTIAERLKQSQNTAAILSTFNEVDMSEIFRIRQSYQEIFSKKHGVKLGFMSFFTKAVVKALKDIPAVNAQIEGDEIVYNNYYDVGIAVGTDQGLVVPVVRDADMLSFADVEKKIADLGKKAREGKLTMGDMSGATFTITNGGTYGSLLSTPIINPPQSGILGMHNIVQRPVAVDGQVVIRPMMYIALSYDHRIIDGKEAVGFLVKVKEIVENPEKLLFDL